jgi:dolichol-phosphate mannosyltransferase
MDGDPQHAETILLAMLLAVENGGDLAIGSHHVDGGTAHGGFSAARGSLSGAGAWLAQRLLPVPLERFHADWKYPVCRR